MFTITPATLKAPPVGCQSAKWGSGKGPFLRCLDLRAERGAWDSGNILQAAGAYGHMKLVQWWDPKSSPCYAINCPLLGSACTHSNRYTLRLGKATWHPMRQG